ncbi:hypothetical protein [Ramlibacter albus]|uniref:Uncharacterized protein n=1 Tax=Ramlibacter albus TaxID=2079448 RepID=A0A923M9S3_9BURK|nr:hypothetical protein [Ramlibacter albus]MBC5765506.1 hypothetical protein [Ramlibacter albus]
MNVTPLIHTVRLEAASAEPNGPASAPLANARLVWGTASQDPLPAGVDEHRPATLDELAVHLGDLAPVLAQVLDRKKMREARPKERSAKRQVPPRPTRMRQRRRGFNALAAPAMDPLVYPPVGVAPAAAARPHKTPEARRREEELKSRQQDDPLDVKLSGAKREAARRAGNDDDAKVGDASAATGKGPARDDELKANPRQG